MVKKLSDKNQTITFVPQPQSPMLSGTQINVASNDVAEYTANNWLECNGAAISRTTYASLFSKMGTKYGVGDGSTTFNLPSGPRRTVEVDLGNFAAFTTSTDISKGYVEQTVDGNWFFIPTIAGDISVASTSVSPSFSALGLSFDDTGRQIIPGGNNASLGTNAVVTNPTTVQLLGSSSSTRWALSGRILLTGKPTDDFVSNDSRFTTFDEALESVPMVKAFDDLVNGVSVGITPATSDVAGIVRSPGGVLRMHTSNGFGSIASTVRKFVTTLEDVGGAFTHIASEDNGSSFQCNRNMLIEICYQERALNTQPFGIVINSNSGSTNITDLTPGERVGFAYTVDTSGGVSIFTKSLFVSMGDILKCQTSGSANFTNSNDKVEVTFTELARL